MGSTKKIAKDRKPRSTRASNAVSKKDEQAQIERLREFMTDFNQVTCDESLPADVRYLNQHWNLMNIFLIVMDGFAKDRFQSIFPPNDENLSFLKRYYSRQFFPHSYKAESFQFQKVIVILETMLMPYSGGIKSGLLQSAREEIRVISQKTREHLVRGDLCQRLRFSANPFESLQKLVKELIGEINRYHQQATQEPQHKQAYYKAILFLLTRVGEALRHTSGDRQNNIIKFKEQLIIRHNNPTSYIALSNDLIDEYVAYLASSDCLETLVLVSLKNFSPEINVHYEYTSDDIKSLLTEKIKQDHKLVDHRDRLLICPRYHVDGTKSVSEFLKKYKQTNKTLLIPVIDNSMEMSCLSVTYDPAGVSGAIRLCCSETSNVAARLGVALSLEVFSTFKLDRVQDSHPQAIAHLISLAKVSLNHKALTQPPAGAAALRVADVLTLLESKPMFYFKQILPQLNASQRPQGSANAASFMPPQRPVIGQGQYEVPKQQGSDRVTMRSATKVPN